MNNLSKIEGRTIEGNQSIMSALKQMDDVRSKLLFVFSQEKFLGILTIGDIQRSIWIPPFVLS